MTEKRWSYLRHVAALALVVALLFGVCASPWAGSLAFAARAEDESAGLAQEEQVPETEAEEPEAEPMAPQAEPASAPEALTVGSSGNVNGGDYPANTAGLQAAVEAIANNGSITLMTGVGLDAPIAVPAGKTLTMLCGHNWGPEYTRITSMYGTNPNYTGDMFVVNAGAHLIVKGLIIHGNNQVQDQARVLVRVNNGAFTLEDSKLMYANNTPNTNAGNCMILADGANAVVTLNNALVDLGVYHGIILENAANLNVLEGSKITRSKYTGVLARGGSVVRLAGGGIVQNGDALPYYTNTTPLQGGGVYLDASELIITAGSVENNRATQGSGVYAANGSVISLQGGSITGNGKVITGNLLQGTRQGGGVLLHNSRLLMQGGVITGNAAARGGGVYSTNGSGIEAAAGQIGSKDGDNGVYLDADSAPVSIPDAGMQPGTRINIEGYHSTNLEGVVAVVAGARAATQAEAEAFRAGTGGAYYSGWPQAEYVLMGEVRVTEVKLSQSSITLAAGQSATISAEACFSNGGSTTEGFTWKSSNEAVATVEDGKITAKRRTQKSTAVITASYGGYEAQIKVTVLAAAKVTKVAINGSKKPLEVGKTAQLKAKISPRSAAGASVTWKSSKPSVLRVDSTGKLTALKEGKATITLKAGKQSAKVTIKVVAPVSSIKVDKTSVKLKKGQKSTITPTVVCSVEGYKAKLTWKSSDTQVATVKNGKITAKGKGAATITVSATNGKNAKIKVKVKKK